ncbi:hypothetical protein EXE46_02140 [Halorubrum sp. GN11_10-6_MGM]|uniref:hypothetical protein n=1 Tax=Halorubrum sp. GN11_10-6_MGM TaxID=2518112 RepID=UPI0010F4335E|nr:hypothetical protein [Halorubrum sp. GN11_10-6_MGM]TKX75921.1 hypothetical protein EXE46_02140 [Halorubrum sp. GN11_10-6_MGM]
MGERTEVTRGSLPVERSAGRFSGPDGLRDVVERLLAWLRNRREAALESVSTATTMRNVVDADALADETPEKWSVVHDVVTYGSSPLTDVLVFRHGPSRQDLVMLPERNTRPEGEISFYHADRTRGARHLLSIGADSLTAALSYVLERIERFERLFTGRGSQLPSGYTGPSEDL